MEKIEIKSMDGSVIFSYEAEDNTLKKTLEEAVKKCVDLQFANLRFAYIRGAKLSGAKLSGANLDGADLRDADLEGADLGVASLISANLREANLCNTRLYCAELLDADLYCANLRGAVLRCANLRGADFRGAKEVPYTPLACPSDGAFIGWKKVNGCLVKLLIPEDAKRCSATREKCRCEFAKVVSITRIKDGEELQSVINGSHFPTITYRVGEIARPDSFDEDRWNECSHGIHFFINKQDAIDY